VPVEALLATSRGVARKVHEAAAEWARREATRGVGLQSARERADLVRAGGDVAVAPAVCPYKGLATFDAADAEYFFGRERLVAELVARLAGAPLLAIVGPSGSGKSSVLRAGLLPALAGGVLPGSNGWIQALIRPGEQPRQRRHVFFCVVRRSARRRWR
jgi:hypothetical protein